MVMLNQFDLIGDTDVDDPLQIALAQIEILKKKAADAAAAAAAEAEILKKKAAAAAADAAADQEPPVETTQKGVLEVPHDAVPYQSRRGQNGRGRGSRRNFESNRYVDGVYAVPEDRAQKLLGKPSIRGHSDQPYRGRGGGGGGGRGYLNRDNGDQYDGRPARRQFERQSGFSSPPAKDKGEPAKPVKDAPVPQVELKMTPEQNLEENATLEGKSSNPKEPAELDNAPTSNALNKDKEGMANGRKAKEPEVKLMTLEEYQKKLDEKRRSLVAMKTTQERKVDVDKEFESMQQLVVKKENNEFFIKLGNDKEAGKRKEDTDGDERVKKDTTDRVEKVKKSVSMDQFLKLAERRGRGGYGGGYRGGRGYSNSFSDESITDTRQFPALGGKEVEQQSSAAQGKKVEQQHSWAQGRK